MKEKGKKCSQVKKVSSIFSELNAPWSFSNGIIMPFSGKGGTHPQKNAVGVEFSPVGVIIGGSNHAL